MKQKQIKNSLFICLSIFIFFIDLALFGFLHHHTLLLLHSFIILLIVDTNKNQFLLFPLFLLCLLSYLDTNMFGSCLIYIIPTLFLTKYVQEQIQIKVIIPYLIFFTSLLLKKLTLEYMSLTNISWYNFTYSGIINLISFLLLMTLYNFIEQKK